MTTIQIKLEPGRCYHLFNRGNNRGNIFFKPDNFRYFLQKYVHYLSPYLDTYAYCLMPNHFHFLVKIKDERDFPHRAESKSDFPSLKGLESLKSPVNSGAERIVSEQFRRFFMAYSKAINKQEGREGSLFRKYFRRKLITGNCHLLNTIYYIHHNPVHHGFTGSLTDYTWTSFHETLSDGSSLIQNEDVISLFGNKANFMDFHQRAPNNSNPEEYIIDD